MSINICSMCGVHNNYCECENKPPKKIHRPKPKICAYCKTWMGSSKNRVHFRYVHKKCERKYIFKLKRKGRL